MFINELKYFFLYIFSSLFIKSSMTLVSTNEEKSMVEGEEASSGRGKKFSRDVDFGSNFENFLEP